MEHALGRRPSLSRAAIATSMHSTRTGCCTRASSGIYRRRLHVSTPLPRTCRQQVAMRGTLRPRPLGAGFVIATTAPDVAAAACQTTATTAATVAASVVPVPLPCALADVGCAPPLVTAATSRWRGYACHRALP